MSVTIVQESSVQNVICLSSAQIESHNTNVEEDDEDVMSIVVSSIPNIQRFSSMLVTLSFQHFFSELNFSSIMEASVSMFTSSVDSPIHSIVSSLS